MATLAELSASDRLTQLVVSAMIEERPIIGQWEFYPHPGNSDNPRKSSTASGGGYRSINSDHADNEVDPAFANMILAILGDKVETDVAHERRGFDIASVRASDLRQFAREMAKFLVNEHVKGGGQGSNPPDEVLDSLAGVFDVSASELGELRVEQGGAAYSDETGEGDVEELSDLSDVDTMAEMRREVARMQAELQSERERAREAEQRA